MGALTGGRKVFGVRDHRQSDAPNRLPFTATEGRTLYRRQHEVEDVIKVLKSQRSLAACQGGDTRSWKAKSSAQEGAPTHHSAVCQPIIVLSVSSPT